MGITRTDKQLKNNPNLFEIGDYFRIDFNKGTCKFPNKIYQIVGFSKSHLHIYYEDNRTNIKCKCFQCNIERNAIKLENGWYKTCKSIMIGSCKLYMTEKQYIREKRFKKLLDK